MEKQCFRCHETKPLDEFYAHRLMADGHLNKCKSCTKNDVIANRAANIMHYRAYDVERNKTPKRLEKLRLNCRRFRQNNPRKYAAHTLLNNAIRAGKLNRKPCERCGAAKSHAHHEDYDKPLEVVWLCAPCHSLRHKEMKKEGKTP